MYKVIKDIEEKIDDCKKNGEDLDAVSFNYEIGVLISANTAQRIVSTLKAFMEINP